jgi:Na+:H+ antiporter, NhaA family
MSSKQPGTLAYTTKLERGLERLASPFEEFVRHQATAGVLLLVATVGALLLANSPFKDAYFSLFETRIGLFAGDWRLEKSLLHWINDGLMALFFFLLGLEIKRELLVGDLRAPRRALLVLLAALGGMLFPAALYFLINPEGVTSHGWAIPMATDTAFALGAMALLGSRVPRGLLAFVAALAIIDDIGAVLVIAIFYSQAIDWHALAWVGVLLGVLLLFNNLGVRQPLPYALAALLVWYWVVQSGIHATVAGVLVASAIPARPKYSPQRFRRRVATLLERFRRAERKGQDAVIESDQQHAMVQGVHQTAKLSTTPLQRWEDAWEIPVGVLVLPLFAFANAGVSLDAVELSKGLVSGVTLGVVVGLVLGKAAGISFMTWLGLRSRLGSLPDDLDLKHVLGMSLLAGIGFTMSIFIAQLAFDGNATLLTEAKIGILAASTIAGAAGLTWLAWVGKRNSPETGSSDAQR